MAKAATAVKGAWKRSKRCLVERSGKAERSEKDRKKHLKPFFSNGFNRSSGEFSRKKLAQTCYTSVPPGPQLTPSFPSLTRSRPLKSPNTDLFKPLTRSSADFVH